MRFYQFKQGLLGQFNDGCEEAVSAGLEQQRIRTELSELLTDVSLLLSLRARRRSLSDLGREDLIYAPLNGDLRMRGARLIASFLKYDDGKTTFRSLGVLAEYFPMR